jgi:cobalt transporter subunit CbtB
MPEGEAMRIAHPLVHAAAAPGAGARTRARLLPCALAALLGVVLLYGVGLSHLPAVHDATHDTRHAAGFPCH